PAPVVRPPFPRYLAVRPRFRKQAGRRTLRGSTPAGGMRATHAPGGPSVQPSRVERQLGAQKLILETGKLAKQAHGAAIVQYGESFTRVPAVQGEADPGRDFFPLVVDYREKTYAAGKFPGGFIKREGRPTTKEILPSRLIDRPIRP